MKQASIVVLDLGGTKINVGRYRDGKIEQNMVQPFDGQLSVSDSIVFLIGCINKLKLIDTCAIAIGVPSIVDVEQGIVYSAVNIASWKKVHLKNMLEEHFSLPVYVNNDVNCFSVGEHLSGAGKGFKDMIGLCLGTGLGAGIILHNKLYSGRNGCAGEIGSISYLDSTLDDYCSGNFFKTQFNHNGEVLAVKARNGDKIAIGAFQQFGLHLSAAIKQLLLMFDPELIVIGGSVGQSFDLFIEHVWQSLDDFPYKNMLESLSIEQSQQQQHSALIGAAHLYLTSQSSL
ncbi:ROK family protein [Paraglaciecola sp.]|uniref:ROK family protein n=1 Tax=Paraglaciecola sp. TaxID=1920173 RepID=UPI0030F3DB9D